VNQKLQTIQELILKSENLSQTDKDTLITAVKDADRQFTIVEFKLDRTEKVKRTTAILLEETIEELEQKRKIVEDSHEALKKSMNELKATQAQLIQSEKMASLGELTAGIAHEIQNPLNFVLNFSEVSVDLADELKEEVDSGDIEEVHAIAGDLKQNMEKIVHHGRRASDIVKGMLEHSQTGSGEKTPTDLNAIADEYLRLSYHGLRAKDSSFNADFKTNLDGQLPKVEVMPQDFGRVLINLINNAFYAVNTKSKTNENSSYKPLIIVKTKLATNHIEVSVADNGNGIPEDVREKIFQPFFTTKPTGEGTGLGLSLSYDIITKGHGGEIEVKSVENTGTEFIITLPLK